MHVRMSVLVFALLLGGSVPAASQGPPSLESIHPAIEEGLRAWQVPGLALAVVRDGKIVLARGYGVANLRTREPVTPDTQFYTGSATKSFTATLAAMVVAEGKAAWDRPVREWAAGFRMFDPVATERVTLRDLLSHRTGLPRLDFLKVNAPGRRTDLVDRIRYFEPTIDFRSGFQYSNEAVTVAGDLLARADGTTWEDMVRRRILRPLGMSRSTVSVDEMRSLGEYASPYIVRQHEPEEMAFYDVGELRGPAGGLISSVNDLSKWLLFNMSEGRSNGVSILDAQALAELWVPRVPVTRRAPRFPELSHQSYALGWIIDAYRGSLRISHPGNLYGFTSAVSFLPREKIGVAVLANLNGTPLPQIVERLVYDTLLGLPQIDWSGRLEEEEARLRAAVASRPSSDPARRPEAPPSRPLASFEGTYGCPGYGTLQVQRRGEGLAVVVRSGTFPLRHHNEDTFEFFHPVEGQSWLLAFRRDSSGGIAAVAIDGGQGSPEILMTRAAAQKGGETDAR